MKIGLNGQRLLIDKPAGPEVYTHQLYKSLAKIDKNNKYVIYFEKQPPDGFFKELTQNNPNFSYKVLKKVFSWTQISLAFELLINPVDVFFSAAHTIPGIPTLLTFGKFKSVIMIHGLETKTNQDLPALSFKKFAYPFVLFWITNMSTKIIVPSTATKNEIIKEKWLGIYPDKITVIHEGVSDLYHKRSAEEIQKVKSKFDLGSDRYLYTVSTIQPRKNMVRMIEAFSLFVKENPAFADLKLLITGKKGWHYEDTLRAPKKFGVDDKVKFLGRTSDEDKAVLYSGAEAFISTSIEEGFGLPLLEAMASEIPCVVSDISSYKEIGQDTPIYVDPLDPESIKSGIKKVLTDPNFAGNSNNLMRAKMRTRQFTWEKTALKVYDILRI